MTEPLEEQDQEDRDDLHWMYLCADCGDEFHVPGPSRRGFDLPRCPVCDGPSAGLGASQWFAAEARKTSEGLMAVSPERGVGASGPGPA